MDTILTTGRLVLRPLRPEDAAAVRALADNWNVASMVGRIPYPYRDGLAEAFIAESARLSAAGDAYRFAVVLTGQLVGCIGLEREGAGRYELGYWIGEPYWSRGIATEAAQRVLRFAFETLGAELVTAGHFAENFASRRILEKCGFQPEGAYRCWCEARGQTVATARYRLCREPVQA